MDHVQDAGGGPWLPIAQSPFAAHGAAPPAAAPAATKPSLGLAQWVFIIVSLLLLSLAVAVGWFGIVAGAGVVVWSVVRYRNGQPSLMDLAWRTPRGLGKTALTLGLGLLTGLCGSTSLMANREAEAKKAQAAKARAAAVQKGEDDRQALLAQLPSKIASWRQRMNDVNAPAGNGGVEAARDAASAIVAEATTYEKMLAPQVVPELAGAQTELQARAKSYVDWVSLLDNVRTVTEQTAAGKASAQAAQWLAADTAYSAASSALDQIQAADAATAAHLPPTFKPDAQRSTLEQLKKAIAPRVTSEKQRLEREAAQRKAQADKEAVYAAVCGEKPLVSSWDGEVVGLESSLRESANDPDSIDVEKCTDPKLTPTNCWVVTCNVRGKNGFGALILLRKTYYYSKSLGFQEAH